MDSKRQMYIYIINDAVDDFQDTIDGVKELARVFQDEKLDHIVRELGEYKTYVSRLKGKALLESDGCLLGYSLRIDNMCHSDTDPSATPVRPIYRGPMR